MSPILEGKTALITGAASGIGAAAARVFSRHGARLVLADIDDEGGQSVAEGVVKNGGEAMFVHTDITSDREVAAMVQAVAAAYGRLDCAFNNAAIDGAMAPLHEASAENWEQVLRVNLTGVFLCLKHEIAQMLRQGGGSIVNTASVAGLVGAGTTPASAYVASKHGVVGLTRQAALEYAEQRIRVNAVCPGAVRTPMTQEVIRQGLISLEDIVGLQPVKRLAAPEEIAESAAWLCSGLSSFITGHAMAVDGGWTAQ
ncbi:SDR family oxidoreductase [Nonomuraea roseoviolacea subsp. roseoviolacea]|uniref:glucose 1-dehydrogenase n=1 Tax=Nonomuraea roseoviolacea TaxID=103837 RepID=UPI0031CEA246